MTDIDQIREEIDRATERRAELWHLLSEGHDAELAAELHALEERLAALWDQQRLLKARVRFGDRDEIIKRARHEERLARAAQQGLSPRPRALQSPPPEPAAFSRRLAPFRPTDAATAARAALTSKA